MSFVWCSSQTRTQHCKAVMLRHISWFSFMVFLWFISHTDFVSVDSSSEGFPASREIQVHLNPSAAGIWQLSVR